MILMAATLLVGASTAPPTPLHPAYQYLHKFTVRDAAARGALCNDGSAAAYYYRNCTANGDRRWGAHRSPGLHLGTWGQERQWVAGASTEAATPTSSYMGLLKPSPVRNTCAFVAPTRRTSPGHPQHRAVLQGPSLRNLFDPSSQHQHTTLTPAHTC